MKNINKKRYIAVVLSLGIATLPAFAAFAQTGLGLSGSGSISASVVSPSASTSVNVGAKVSAAMKALINKVQTNANEEITRRDDALSALNARVQAMQNLPATVKTNISSMIQTQLNTLNTLETQVQTNASVNNTSSLKNDIRSITDSYHLFALVMPEGAIEAAANRVMDVTKIMQTLSVKLQARITALQATGADVSTSAAALADMNAKISDANAQAQAAVNEVAALQPDQGNATVKASNTATFKDARTKIQAAHQDLVSARADIRTILIAISVNTTSTVQATSTPK